MAEPLPDDDAPSLNPRQAETLAALAARPADRPTFPADLGARLRADLEAELAGTVAGLPDGERLSISKRDLAGVHGCQARWLDEEEREFVVSPPVVRGTVVHKAIELGLNRRPGTEPPPAGEMVDRALDNLERSDSWVTDWLTTCDEDDRATVRSDAVEHLTAFDEVWPPLERRWRPVTEARVRAELCDGRVRLAGRVDLALGRPEGTTAGKVLVDFKTGGWALHHIDDLRFYALVETLRLGVPPRLLASSYLDSGRLHTETVTEDLLHATVARVVDGAQRIVALVHHDHPPERRPSTACRWCPLRDDCDEGTAHLEALARGDAPDSWGG